MTKRRDWLKQALALTAGIPLSSTFANQLMAMPVSEAERNFFSLLAPNISVRLDSNENPYGPSEKAKQAIIKSMTEGNRYPFRSANELKEVIAKKEGVSTDYILLGAGSGELLCTSATAFSVDRGSIVSGFPTFPMLMNYAEVFNTRWEKVNLNEKLEYNYEALASAIKADTQLVFICNPNNPTGTLVDHSVVKSFCEEVSNKVPVYSDEAYLEFLEPNQQVSMVDLVKQGKNVIVSRTFSKVYGLAGVRLGYLVAPPDMIKKISKYTTGIALNQPGIAAAKASLGDESFMAMTRKKNAEARKHLTDYLDKKKIFYGKSHTNFVFFEAPSDGKSILTKLSDRGIGIRLWDYNNKQWCRVSIGTLEEMKKFTSAFDAIA